ncbi:unnamed protein product [Coregonus sp. 'balchen']|nr:unnamed protein product [Coregonus sp. 'balchen']
MVIEGNIQHRKYARWKATYIHNCLKSGETPQAGPDGYEEETYDEEYGAEGGGGPSYQSSQPAQPQSPPHSQPGFGDPDQGPGSMGGPPYPQGPGSMGGPPYPPTNYNNIHIPPGAHCPANTPAGVAWQAVVPEVCPSLGLPGFTLRGFLFSLPLKIKAKAKPGVRAGGEPIKPVPVPRSIPAVDPSLLSATQEVDVRLTPEDYTRAQKYCKYAGSALQYEDVGTAVQNLQKALNLLTTGKE